MSHLYLFMLCRCSSKCFPILHEQTVMHFFKEIHMLLVLLLLSTSSNEPTVLLFSQQMVLDGRLYVCYVIQLNTVIISHDEWACMFHCFYVKLVKKRSNFSKSNILQNMNYVASSTCVCKGLTVSFCVCGWTQWWSSGQWQMKGGSAHLTVFLSLSISNCRLSHSLFFALPTDRSALKQSPTFECFFFKVLSSFCCFLISLRYVCSRRECMFFLNLVAFTLKTVIEHNRLGQHNSWVRLHLRGIYQIIMRSLLLKKGDCACLVLNEKTQIFTK